MSDQWGLPLDTPEDYLRELAQVVATQALLAEMPPGLHVDVVLDTEGYANVTISRVDEPTQKRMTWTRRLALAESKQRRLETYRFFTKSPPQYDDD